MKYILIIFLLLPLITNATVLSKEIKFSFIGYIPPSTNKKISHLKENKIKTKLYDNVYIKYVDITSSKKNINSDNSSLRLNK